MGLMKVLIQMTDAAEEKEKGATKIQIYHTNTKGRLSAPERRLWTRQDYYFLKHQRKRRENTINQVSYKIRIIPVIFVFC